MTGALACLDITVSAGTVTFANGTSPTLNVRGSMTLLAGTVWSATGSVTFTATTTGKTITTNGTAINGPISFNGFGGEWTLGSALTATGTNIDFTLGIFNTGNYNVTASQLVSTNFTSRTINLGSSTITLSTFSAGAINFTLINGGMVLNAGTSQINFTNASAGILTSGGALTFYNVAFTNTNAGSHPISGTHTFNNFAVTAPLFSAGTTSVTFNAQQTINGALSTNGTAGNRRVLFLSATYGISVDLVVNSAPSLTDADFRGLYVRGTSAPISGTRIGNRGECRGITFDAPKTVYWNLAGAQNWSADGWATTSTGAPSANNFPLPQDTATFTNAGSVTGTITLNTAIGYVPTVDMSGRTTAMTLGTSNATTVYGNWTNGSGTAFTGTGTLTFQGGGTQTITSAGKSFTAPITVDTYGGTVQLADALDIGQNTLTVTNGTFTTASYAVAFGVFSSNNSNVRTISLGASAVTSYANNGGLLFGTTTNLTFNAGTSQITLGGSPTSFSVQASGLTFYNVLLDRILPITYDITGQNTFNNLTITGPVIGGLNQCSFSANQTINGTLTCNGAAAAQRIFLRSNTLGTQRTITAAAISATDCDFRDIILAGAAAGSSPTRAGDCGNNTGVTFPAPKTVYWNLAGAQSWSANGWATSSGGAPAVNNFPLAQDTAVFDNAGAAGTVTINSVWNIGTFDASLRTSAMTLSASTISPLVYGDWKFGTGVTSSSTTGTLVFSKNGTQTITSNGVQFGCPVTINRPSATVQLADALSLNSARTLLITSGTFDAVTYNVTVGISSLSSGSTVRMGSGTWTLSGTGSIWTGNATLFVGTSTIVLSDTSTATRIFNGNNRYYNKLTIGGTTGTSTLILGSAVYGELASTKTVAHTITFDSGVTTTVGKWSVTGTAGNVVTVNSNTAASAFTLSIAGPANTGIDYLSIRDCTVLTTSPGEFYVGVNSTNVSGNTRVIFTATPAARTLYWVGGTGNWSSTTKWDTTSGGGGGAAIPTSLDAVNFNSASNATAYTATIDAGVALARCASFTMAGPAAGNVTFAGSVGIAFHGNVSFAATGITRTYTGAMNWAGNASYTFTTNGVVLASSCTVIGIGSTWTLGSNINIGVSTFTVTYGTFSTSASNYSLTAGIFTSNSSNVRTISLNSSTLTLSSSGPVTFTTSTNLTFNAGASTITMDASAPIFNGGGQTFYNVTFNQPTVLSASINGANTFNNLTFTGRTSIGISSAVFSANQTINGTLTVSAGTAAAYRTFLASDTLGTTRTLTCAAVSATDVDFRDITIAGAAAPASGTRLGDAKGNSGITFPAAKTVYWALAGGNNWGNTGAGSWSATSGGAAANTEFPLAQDTAYIPFATPTSGSTITVNANYNIGTLDMSNRNGSALITLATGTTTPTIYGNWINGTGTTLVGTGVMTFAGRGSQQITSSGRTFSQRFDINTPSGSVTLQDAFIGNNTTSNVLSLTTGTFDANGYAVTFSATVGVGQVGTAFGGVLPKTLAIGSGTWTLAGSGTPWDAFASTNLTVTGSGTISLTSASAKSFAGGGVSYSGVTLNQGGAGALTITGNNTFKTITNTYSATGATSIAFGGTTTTLTDPWTATGAATRVLTISGSPATLVYTGSGTAANVDYLSISNVRGYPLVDEWYAGPNSTNGGSLGWYFIAAPGVVYFVTVAETGTGTDSISAGFRYLGTVSELATSSDAFAAAASFRGVVSESGAGTDTISARSALCSAILESATIADTNLARLIARATLSETATGTDTDTARLTTKGTISETATGTEAVSPRYTALPSIAETATGTDTDAAKLTAKSSIAETATGTDTDSATRTTRPSVSETATVTDTDSAKMSARSTVSELATISDLASARATLLAAFIDSATATDLISAIKGLFANIIESASITDAVNAPGSIYGPNVSETATAADTVAALARFASRVTEAATISDAVTAFKVYLAAVLESALGVDAVTAKLVARSVVSELATGTDLNVVRFIAKASISEAATGTDTETPRYIANPSVAESTTITDADATKITARSSIVEAATGTETVSPRYIANPNIVEAASITDAVATRYIALPSIFESASGSDIVVGGLRFIVVIAETATGTETVTPRYIAQPTIAESATGTEAITTRATFRGVVSETALAQEIVQAFFTAAAQVSELATGTDQVSALRALAAAVAETATVTDSLSARAVFIGLLQEAATAQDAVNAPGSTYNILMQELAQAQDAITAQAIFPVSLAETATGTEINQAAFIPRATISESATITDAVSALQAFAASISETSAASDVVLVAPSIFNAIAVASATALDNLNAPGSIYNVTVPESATLSDSVIGAFLWNLIDDSQSVNWQNVVSEQSVSWNAINASQNADWNNVDNTQSTSWGNIQDDQDPDWNDIPTLN
jgi:hypothetical protein